MHVIFLSLFSIVQAGRVLVVVPTPSISHQVVFRPLTQELARRGHEVVVITTDAAFPKGQTPKNLTEIEIHDITYKRWGEVIMTDVTSGSSNDIFTQVSLIIPTVAECFEMQMNAHEVKTFLENKTEYFDLIMTEAIAKSAISLVHAFKAPLILVSSFGGFGDLYDIFGAPSRPSFNYPTVLWQKIFDLSFWEKIKALYHNYVLEQILTSQLDNDDRTARRLFGPETPSIHELANKVAMLFLNVHPIWEFNRPVPPNIIYMGGLHQKPSKELPQDLKSYLDSSKHGVIYVSYGTNVDPTLLPPEKIQILVKTLSQLPYDVLWKWNNDELPGRSNNIRISKWLPQSDLLQHPKVKLFITQGGLQSTDEAITAGVPLIGMPMLGDQWYNVEHYAYYGIGLRVDMETVTEDRLKNAIENVMANEKSYRANVLNLRGIMHDQPQPPLDRAVWWAEHVMRHGGAPHLRARVANMTWSEYLDAELIFFVSLLVLVGLTVVGFAISLVLSSRGSSVLLNQKLKAS